MAAAAPLPVGILSPSGISTNRLVESTPHPPYAPANLAKLCPRRAAALAGVAAGSGGASRLQGEGVGGETRPTEWCMRRRGSVQLELLFLACLHYRVTSRPLPGGPNLPEHCGRDHPRQQRRRPCAPGRGLKLGPARGGVVGRMDAEARSYGHHYHQQLLDVGLSIQSLRGIWFQGSG